MSEALALELNKTNEVEVTSNAKNIFENISDAFSNAVNKGIEILPLPEKYESVIKDGIKNFDFKTLGSEAIEAALKTGMRACGMKVSTFNNLKEIGQAIKEGDLKKGLSAALNIGINSIKVPTTVKNVIRSGKDLILGDTFDDELQKVMTSQKNTISRLNKECIKFEEALEKNDIKSMDKIAKSIKSDLERVMPIQNVIEKANTTLNKYELMQNKNSVNLTEQEKELCKTLSM